jgi:hypothetical protein
MNNALTAIGLIGLIVLAHLVAELLALLLPFWVQVVMTLGLVFALVAALLWVAVQLARTVR